MTPILMEYSHYNPDGMFRINEFGLEIPASVPGACQAFGQHECSVSAEIVG